MPCDSGFGALHKRKLYQIYPQITKRVDEKSSIWEKIPNPLPIDHSRPLEVSLPTERPPSYSQERGRGLKSRAKERLRRSTKISTPMGGSKRRRPGGEEVQATAAREGGKKRGRWLKREGGGGRESAVGAARY